MDKLYNTILSWLPDIGVALLIVVGGIIITKLIVMLFKRAMSKTSTDPSLVNFFVYAIRILAYSVIGISALTRLGVSTAGLIAFFSAAVAAVALALKDNISDIASGIIILFTRPFVTGDYIEFGDYKGFVQKIDLVHTKLLTYEDTNIIIPNSRVTTNEINNYTDHPTMRVRVDVPVSYMSDIEMTKKVLLEAAKQTPNIYTDSEHTPVVRLNRFGESSLDYFILCWCDFKDYWAVYFSLTELVKKAMDQNGIHIPYNQLDVHIVDNKSQQDDN